MSNQIPNPKRAKTGKLRLKAKKLKDLREDFPIFKHAPSLAYLDSAATSLKPQSVIDAENDYYSRYPANVRRGIYALSEKATAAYENSRKTIRNFINAKSEKEIIFTSGATAAINLAARTWAAQNIKAGDEIILTVLEHHSNIVPWQMLAKTSGCVLKYADIDRRGVLNLDSFSKLLTKKTKLVSVSHISNALGTINPVQEIIKKAHAAGAKALVDSAQAAPRTAIDVQNLDCDFLVFSGHKMCGPTGIGILFAKEKILSSAQPLFGGGDMILEVSKYRSRWNKLPWKFEAGTPPIAQAIALGAAADYLSAIGSTAIKKHEDKLLSLAIEQLKKIRGVSLFGPLDPKIQSGILSFTIKGVHPHDAAEILDKENIAIRAGHHCCMPLMKRLGEPATCRASFYLYNTEEDVYRLADGIRKAKRIFGE